MTRPQFMAQQQAAVEQCLQKNLSRYVEAIAAGLPPSRLARWIRNAHINLGEPGSRDQDILTLRVAGRAEPLCLNN